MDGEPRKISPPKSHPSKAAMKVQNKEVPISPNFPLTTRRNPSDIGNDRCGSSSFDRSVGL